MGSLCDFRPSPHAQKNAKTHLMRLETPWSVRRPRQATEAAEAKARDLSALKAKAKAGLLDAKRSGELEALAKEVRGLSLFFILPTTHC